jgi:hypothetical protein
VSWSSQKYGIKGTKSDSGVAKCKRQKLAEVFANFGISMFDELKALQNIMPHNISSILELFRFLHFNCLHEVFPTVSVALRVLLTIPITVASGERSFSTLKLIKTYLRASMKKDKLNDWALLSIENSVAKELNCSSLIRKFASIKARRVSF